MVVGLIATGSSINRSMTLGFWDVRVVAFREIRSAGLNSEGLFPFCIRIKFLNYGTITVNRVFQLEAFSGIYVISMSFEYVQRMT